MSGRSRPWLPWALLAFVGLVGAAVYLVMQQTDERVDRVPASRTEVINAPAESSDESEAAVVDVDDPEQPTAKLQPLREPAAAGEGFEIVLSEKARTHYGEERWTEADRAYASMIADDDRLHYDPALGQAARELAIFYSQHRRGPPTEAFHFMLASAGAPEWGVLQAFLRTTALDESVVRKRVESLSAGLRDRGDGVRVGVGESYALGKTTERVVAVLVSSGGLYLDPIKRRVTPGERVVVRGSVPRQVTGLTLALATPDGVFRDVKAKLDGDRFEGTVAMGKARGLAYLELIADLPSGPEPLAQLELHVGEPIAEKLSGAFGPDESGIQSEKAAEAYIRDLIAADRARFGLARLQRHSALDAAARVHSRDLVKHQYFAHRSPRTGSVSDRVKAQQYKSQIVAENIAGNPSLHDAQQGLMYSLGHRKNLLSRDVTDLGVGVALDTRGSSRRWLVTQVFAKPLPTIDSASAERALLERIQTAVAQAGFERLNRSRQLAVVARDTARRDGATPADLMATAKSRGLTQRGAWGFVASAVDPANLELPAALTERRYKSIGVAVIQDKNKPAPNVRVVVIVSG